MTCVCVVVVANNGDRNQQSNQLYSPLIFFYNKLYWLAILSTGKFFQVAERNQ